jgi:hypothetical protein
MRNRIDGLIESIAAEVEYLPELAEDWDEMHEEQRFAVSYDWNSRNRKDVSAD